MCGHSTLSHSWRVPAPQHQGTNGEVSPARNGRPAHRISRWTPENNIVNHKHAPVWEQRQPYFRGSRTLPSRPQSSAATAARLPRLGTTSASPQAHWLMPAHLLVSYEFVQVVDLSMGAYMSSCSTSPSLEIEAALADRSNNVRSSPLQ